MKSTKREITSTASCGPYWKKDGGCFNKWKERNRYFSDGGWDKHVNATSADTKKEVLEDGETRIKIQNTGDSELKITGVLIRTSDPIWFTYDLMVITSGMVIIGFSMGFTLRKPKGF